MKLGGSVAIVLATSFVAAGAAITGKPIGFVVVVCLGVSILLAWMKFTR